MTDNTEAPLPPLPEQDFNAWWLSLPEGRRNALIDDKWMLAHASYDAGRATRVQHPAQVDIKALAKRAKLPKYMYDTEGGCDALSRLVAIALGDSVAPTVQPSGATLEPGARSQWISVDERLPEPDTIVLAAFEMDGPGDWRIKCASYEPHSGERAHRRGFRIFGGDWTPTHWMPLPEPPGASAELSSEGEQP